MTDYERLVAEVKAKARDFGDDVYIAKTKVFVDMHRDGAFYSEFTQDGWSKHHAHAADIETLFSTYRNDEQYEIIKGAA